MLLPLPPRPLLAALVLVVLGAGGGSAAEPGTDGGVTTITERLDWAMMRRHDNFGYSDEELRTNFDSSRQYQLDARGLDRTRIVPPPAPGVHPRVLFTAAELPELRRRLADTKPGRLQLAAIRTMLATLLTGPQATHAQRYAQAVRGEAVAEIAGAEPACAIIYEAFRCLIDDDAAGGAAVAAALATLAQADGAALDAAFAKSDQAGKANPVAKPPLRDYQETMGLTQAGLLGLGYDMAFNWMTDAQRRIVRRTIAKASANMTCIGLEAVPALPANTSNWISMHLRLVFLVLAIEGEDGYDPATYQRCIDGGRRYLTMALFPDGEMYEGMGKGFLLAENFVPLMNRGTALLALKPVRTQAGGYFLHALDPWGGHFTFYDSLGGRGNNTPMHDLLVLKHYFPGDPAIDFVYRNTVGEDYGWFKDAVRFSHPFHLADGLIKAVFAHEYDGALTWDQARDRATAGRPLSYFSDDTCNLITRTAWTSDAVQLHVLTRAVSGGHQYADRGHVGLHALGRYWSIYKPLRQVEEHYQADHRSVVMIDGKGAGMSPGRCVAYADGADATVVASDFTTTWGWTTGGNNRFPKGGQRVPFSGNFFRLNKSPLPWMDLSWSDLPNWQSSRKGAELWLPHHPVRHAFRTAGLVRGTHPYVLIVDDLQQDDQPHDYRWLMQLEDDLVRQQAAGNDLVLGERGAAGRDDRRLLVRILDANGTDAREPFAIEPYQLANPPQKPLEMLRLAITAHAVAPGFKVLLFPHRGGQELPTTVWNADHTRLTVGWQDQQDVLTFRRNDDGRTRFTATRAGRAIVSLE